jgi:ubiquitin-protein ligase
MNKRLLKELQNLIVQQNSKPLLENDYLIYFDDENINIIYAIIKGPYESVYRHKFIRLDIFIPKEYPYQPPSVSFVNYDGVRIHPTLYEDGRCCSTILNTWPSIEEDGVKKEAWSSSMGIETILLMFLSFLDYQPYTHEPGGKDDVSYSTYVLYQTWKTCLLRYLYTPQPVIFHEYMNTYIISNINNILNDLHFLNHHYQKNTYYTPCFYIDNYVIDYEKIIDKIYIYYLNFQNINDFDSDTDTETIYQENVQINSIETCEEHPVENNVQKCDICFDDINVNNTNTQNHIVKLDCNHIFHNFCIKRHILHNGKLCSICRLPTDINEWLINPLTNKKIKIDSTTFQKLQKENHI